MSIVIFGSINMDLVVRAPHFPQPGESEIGTAFFTAPGGKGSNQAVASARLGIPTQIIGRVGNDVFADHLIRSLDENGVDTQGVFKDPNHSSGTALITLNDQGENTIVYIPGANNALDDTDLNRLFPALEQAKWLLLQLEIPLEVNLKAARAAHQKGISIMVDPAPAQNISDEFYRLADILTPNETESSHLAGFPVNSIEDARRAAAVFHSRGSRNVIIKMGSKGAYFSSENYQEFLPAYQVTPVDTVAAGDAFNGALAAALHQGMPIRQALTWGMAAGALSTTKAGAQPSLPRLSELLNFLGQNH